MLSDSEYIFSYVGYKMVNQWFVQDSDSSGAILRVPYIPTADVVHRIQKLTLLVSWLFQRSFRIVVAVFSDSKCMAVISRFAFSFLTLKEIAAALVLP
jgi:hypothetical protein